MTSTPRFWFVGGALLALLLAALGWSMVLSPRMDAVAQTRDEAEQLDLQTERVMLQVRELQQQAKDLPDQIRALERIQRRIPDSVDVPELLRDIQRSARAHDVVVEALTPGEITVFSSTEDTGNEGTSTTSSDDPAATPDATAPAPQPTQTDLGQGKVPQGTGLSYVPISVTAAGDFADLQSFTREIETLQRAYLITGVELARADATDSKADNPLTITLDTRIFVASDRLKELPSDALDQIQGES